MCLYGAIEVAKCRIRQVQSTKDATSNKSMHQNQKRATPLKNLGNSSQNKNKKLHLIWSLDDCDMAS